MISVALFLNFKDKNSYMFAVFLFPCLLYLGKILFVKYKPDRKKIVNFIDYSICFLLIIQFVLILTFTSVQNIYVEFDKLIFPFIYEKKFIIESIWPLSIGLFILFHYLNKSFNKPILFTISFLSILFLYVYFF